MASKRGPHGPGCRPYIQGYWARAEEYPRDPPDWHPIHTIEEWRAEWFRGWDEKHQIITEQTGGINGPNQNNKT